MRSHHITHLAALLLCAPLTLLAQETGSVRGRVTDAATGQPVTDARITIEGISAATVTRGNGEYLFVAVPVGRRAVTVRRVGYAVARQEVDVVAGQVATADFSVQVAAVALEAVVVTGLGTPAEKRVVGNTIEVIGGEAISEAPGATSIDQALQGKVTGAWITQNSGLPGGGVSIRLRGTNTILGGSEPLWVVDGVIVDNSADALIGISSNASGARREVGGAAVTNRLADITDADIDRIEVLKGAAAASLYGSRANNGVIQIFTKRGRTGTPQVSFSTDVGISSTPKRLALNMAPTASWADSIALRVPLGGPVARYDIQDQVFRNAASVATQLSVSGGSEGTTYYLSGGRSEVEGIIRPTTWNRSSIRGTLTQEITPTLEVTASGTYADAHQELIPEGEQTQGVLSSIVFTPTAWNPSFDSNLGQYPYNPILGPNPLAVMEQIEASDDITRFIGSIAGRFRPMPSLTVQYLLGMDDYRQQVRYLQPPFSTGPTFQGSIQNPVRTSRQINHDLTATHGYQASPTVGLSTTLGFHYATDMINEVRAAASNLAPEQETVGGGVLDASQFVSEIRTVGGFAEERVSLADRLFINGGLNVEASSSFGADQRWQLYPRLGASYVLGETAMFRNSGLGRRVSTLRLRAAYGETGAPPPGGYTRFDNYVGVSHGGKAGLVASTAAGNPDLKPERQREIEGGFDLGLFSDRALLEFTYYHKRTFDLVLDVPQPPSTGVQTRRENIGELTNRGWEAALTTVNLNRAGLRWRSTLSLGHNKNRVEKLVTSADTLVYGYLNAVIEGQPIGVFYGGIYARNPDGSIAYAPVNVPVYGDVLLPVRGRDTIGAAFPFANRVIGDPNPNLIASFSTTVELGRRLELSLLLDGRFGQDVANFTRRITEFFGADQVIEREINGDTIPRTFSRNPAGRISIYEEYIEDGSFVKLRELALRVRFDQPWVRKLGAEAMFLRFAGRNLLTFTDYSGLDPEINLFTSNTVARGVDFANTPLPRSFTFSVAFNF